MARAKFLSYDAKMPPATDMSPPQAAEVLGCSAPTVRALVADGRLRATETRRGTRTFLRISSEDLSAYLEVFGRFPRRRGDGSSFATGGGGPAQVDAVRSDEGELLQEIRALRRLVQDRVSTAGSSSGSAETVALREAVQLQRAAMRELLDADQERSTGMRMMQDAIAAFERADIKRRNAITIIDEVVGSFTLPGTVEGLD